MAIFYVCRTATFTDDLDEHFGMCLTGAAYLVMRILHVVLARSQMTSLGKWNGISIERHAR